MKTSTILKLNFLVLGLGITIYLSFSLKHHGLSPGFRQLFGLPPAELVATEEDSNFNWSWCDTRVTGLIRPEQFKISQEGNNWVQVNGHEKVIDFVAFEKWLANSCAVRALRSNHPEDASFMPALIVKFVNGQVGVIRHNPNGLYSWKGQAFASPAFDAALDQLTQLPEGRRK
jgi:hypothetical protein